MNDPRYAGLPKICALVAGFARIHDGSREYSAHMKSSSTLSD
jgi:hypothetical protein